MLRIPDATLRDVFPAATSWLQKRHETLSSAHRPGGPLFFRLWDRSADNAYDNAPAQDEPSERRDLMAEALNHPGGVLAWALVDALGARNPAHGAGLEDDLKSRFTRIANAGGHAGLLARVYIMRPLAYFDAIDPAWTAAHLTSRLS